MNFGQLRRHEKSVAAFVSPTYAVAHLGLMGIGIFFG